MELNWFIFPSFQDIAFGFLSLIALVFLPYDSSSTLEVEVLRPWFTFLFIFPGYLIQCHGFKYLYADGFHIYISKPGFPSLLQTTCSAFPFVVEVVHSNWPSIFPFKPCGLVCSIAFDGSPTQHSGKGKKKKSWSHSWFTLLLVTLDFLILGNISRIKSLLTTCIAC